MPTYVVIPNMPALSEIAYDINLGQWGQDMPALFFHVVGKQDIRSAFFAIPEDTAIEFCNRINAQRN